MMRIVAIDLPVVVSEWVDNDKNSEIWIYGEEDGENVGRYQVINICRVFLGQVGKGYDSNEDIVDNKDDCIKNMNDNNREIYTK